LASRDALALERAISKHVSRSNRIGCTNLNVPACQGFFSFPVSSSIDFIAYKCYTYVMEKNTDTLKPKKRNRIIEATLGRLSARSGRQGEVVEQPEPINLTDALRELAEEGYDTLTHGRGPWIEENEARIIDEWAVRHPQGRVTALTVYKMRSFHSGATVRSDVQRADFEGADAYTAHAEEWQLAVSGPSPLADTLARIPEPQAPTAELQ
jgi:hypothetical protein